MFNIEVLRMQKRNFKWNSESSPWPGLIFFLLLFAQQTATAQSYNLIIKGGHVIDARNNIDEVMDIAVSDGKIARVAKNIDESKAVLVINAKGLYVTPGLIDAHVHVFYGTDADRTYSNGPLAVIPDVFTFKTGVTTVVDAGSSGWRNFPLFKKQVIDLSQTRVLAFLNIVGEGMRGGVYEQDTKDMDGKLAGMTARRYHDHIVGIKVAHFIGSEWTPVDEAVKAANLANTPVMIDFGSSNPPLSIEELFMRHLRPGDIFTHCFGQLRDREPIVDINTKKVKSFVWEAQKKGIAFDVGYGSISFAFSQAIPAFKNGFYPNSISTDIHANSMNASMKDMLNIMSKLMSIGMSLQGVVQAATWNPAREIKHEELGHLSEGAIADIAILNVRTGKFGFFDYTGYKVEGTQKLECEMTIKGGKIVYDLDGLATPMPANKMGDH
jgi:dihydroorotase